MIAKNYFITKVSIGVICPNCNQFSYINDIVIEPDVDGFVLDYENLEHKCFFCHLSFKIIIKKEYGGINL